MNISQHAIDLPRFGLIIGQAKLWDKKLREFSREEVTTLISTAINCACVWTPDIERTITWLKATELPDEECQLKPMIKVNAKQYREYLLANVIEGPNGPRAFNGALQSDLRRLYAKYGAK
jgi:hypothetical protein